MIGESDIGLNFLYSWKVLRIVADVRTVRDVRIETDVRMVLDVRICAGCANRASCAVGNLNLCRICVQLLDGTSAITFLTNGILFPYTSYNIIVTEDEIVL